MNTCKELKCICFGCRKKSQCGFCGGRILVPDCEGKIICKDFKK